MSHKNLLKLAVACAVISCSWHVHMHAMIRTANVLRPLASIKTVRKTVRTKKTGTLRPILSRNIVTPSYFYTDYRPALQPLREINIKDKEVSNLGEMFNRFEITPVHTTEPVDHKKFLALLKSNTISPEYLETLSSSERTELRMSANALLEKLDEKTIESPHLQSILQQLKQLSHQEKPTEAQLDRLKQSLKQVPVIENNIFGFFLVVYGIMANDPGLGMILMAAGIFLIITTDDKPQK